MKYFEKFLTAFGLAMFCMMLVGAVNGGLKISLESALWLAVLVLLCVAVLHADQIVGKVRDRHNKNT